MLGLLVGGSASRAEGLLYLMLDTKRSVEQRLIDKSNAEILINQLRVAQPDVKVFFHLTGVNVKGVQGSVEPTFDTGDNPDIKEDALQVLLTPERLPASFREARDTADELAAMGRNLRELRQKALIGRKEAVWAVIFHDLDFTDPAAQTDTSCCALTDGWLKSEKSPFVVKFLRNENSAMKGVKYIVYLSKPTPLAVRRAKETFTAKLLGETGGQLFYMGYNYSFGQTSQSGFTTGMVSQLIAGRLAPLPVTQVSDTLQLQMIDSRGAPVNVPGY